MEEPVKMLTRKRVNFKHLYVQNVPMLDHEDRSMQLLPLNPSVLTLQSWGAWRPAQREPDILMGKAEAAGYALPSPAPTCELQACNRPGGCIGREALTQKPELHRDLLF